ncbi:retrovirus-related pol polyprotein from transposon TNT 1-94, partial [Tanacetum coccineum]
MGTVRFGNDHFVVITVYGDYVQGNLTICHVYYVEGLGHNLFSVGQFCNGDLEVTFRSNTCYVKSKKASIPPKLVPIIESELELLHMDLCGPIRVASINGKKYILVIVDDYSRYTFVYFLRTKDEAPDMIIDFVNQVNRTLVEAARTMLIFSKAPEFLWAEAIATAYFTQNRSIVHTRQSKTPYELIRGRKPNVQYFHVFGYLCYPTNDRDDLGKMKPKADIGIFIGYSESSRGFRIHSQYLQSIPSKSDLDNLFGPLFEEYYSTSLHEVLDDSATNTTDIVFAERQTDSRNEGKMVPPEIHIPDDQEE